ncbi:3-dehydroquinate synthase [Paenibacillus faecis]|uniref:3-dehydroquinate synthase n=1 Tax=Paenibacillus faecis TaxID=862114 RepID=A0A5D0CTM6_9BACL|nr:MULTISPECIES: 3-dehydroquinate synthase [Paenibacillus]MCA1294687.1 3-dehydroquinate synthase [Paenibacillus sp. alder61]TYA13316.1 3-dehydroquinate synthase [Paenibacillus faecis]GIO83540.1 3-dehydroquinate synthase [Paenibacillus faecis]
MRTLQVDLGDRSYPIYIGSGLLNEAGLIFAKHQLSKKSPVLIVTDDHVAPLYLKRVEENLQAEGYRTVSKVVKAGEKAKSLDVFHDVMTAAIEGGLDRRSAVVALGGGVVGDLAGFVAATYMRGVPFVQMPTTILAHDSSVGGKVAINHPLAKNMIGAFHQPELVLYDVDTLRTLPEREIRAGLSEMVKHGLIWDAEFAAWCGENTDRLLALDPETLSYGLTMGCSIKAQVVSQDERELGLRAILNLGHTIGHALEAIGGYGEFLHGEAISIGMAASALIAVNRGADRALYAETVRLLGGFGLPTVMPEHLDEERIIGAMMHDKKFKEQQLVFVLPVAIGQVEIVSDVKVEEVRRVIRELKKEGPHV